MQGMSTVQHLRGIPALRSLRSHHPAVVVCHDDPAEYELRADELAQLDARLIVESEPGPLSERLGRPSVTVSDRFLEVALHAEHISPHDVVETVRWLESRCEECPQSEVDMRLRSGGDG